MKKLTVIVAFFLLTGCSSVVFNPGTGEVTYSRVGNQQIRGLKVIRFADGRIEFEIKDQQSETKVIKAIIKAMELVR